jgi:hypothetical protein
LLEAAGTAGAGVIGTGAGVWAGFGAACFLAAASVGDVAGVGRADGAFGGGVGERDADAVAPGSGVMMLTGGVEEALGNSALVGLPVGTPGINAATVTAAATAGGAFQTAE